MCEHCDQAARAIAGTIREGDQALDVEIGPEGAVHLRLTAGSAPVDDTSPEPAPEPAPNSVDDLLRDPEPGETVEDAIRAGIGRVRAAIRNHVQKATLLTGITGHRHEDFSDYLSDRDRKAAAEISTALGLSEREALRMVTLVNIARDITTVAKQGYAMATALEACALIYEAVAKVESMNEGDS